MGESHKALRDWTKLLELNPKEASVVYNSRGFIYNKLGMFAEAVKENTRAIELDNTGDIAFKYI